MVGLSCADIFRTIWNGGFFNCGRPRFLVQKFGIFKIYGVSARTKGRGNGQFFSILCGRPLWTAPYFEMLYHWNWGRPLWTAPYFEMLYHWNW